MSYAIFTTGGKQYKVSQGDRIDVEKLDLPVGGQTSFSNVLLVSDGSALKIGDPYVEGATITAEVLDQFRDKKVLSFKFRRRTGFHKTRGHRRHLTKLSITGISA